MTNGKSLAIKNEQQVTVDGEVIEQNSMMPLMDIETATERFSQVAEFVQRIMKKDKDFGTIPGTSKPTLYKPGAEKLTTFFGLTKRFDIIEKAEDWMGEHHKGEPFFYYLYRCSLYRGNLLIAEADGSCNSFEVKYRYRNVERTCPECGQANIRKSKSGAGWYCWIKTGGCGSTFSSGDVNIERQELGRIPNPDICDQVNTFQKMAQKRALVAATLLAVNASDFFTQDVEDYIVSDDKNQPPKEEDRPSPEQKNRTASKKKVERNYLDDLFDEVQRRTDNYYTHKAHLYNTLGEWPPQDDTGAIAQAIEMAVTHVSNKVDEKAAAEE